MINEKLLRNKQYEGTMKNFYLDKNFGFLRIDGCPSDIFVHYKDLEKAGIDMNTIKTSYSINLVFELVEYKSNEGTQQKAHNISNVKIN